MKKLFVTLAAVTFMFSGALTAQAYSETVSGVQCYCSISGNNVFAYTACSNTTVTITSAAYAKDGSVIVSNGNAGGGHTSVNYTASGVYYAQQTHSAPNLGVSVTLRQYT